MLETKRQKGAIKLGTNNPDMVMSHKQGITLLLTWLYFEVFVYLFF